VGHRLRIPVARAIFLLGIVSFLTDIAGEMVQPRLPLYLIAVGAGGLAVGAVEGQAGLGNGPDLLLAAGNLNGMGFRWREIEALG
jgi:hypothetical protein